MLLNIVFALLAATIGGACGVAFARVYNKHPSSRQVRVEIEYYHGVPFPVERKHEMDTVECGILLAVLAGISVIGVLNTFGAVPALFTMLCIPTMLHVLTLLTRAVCSATSKLLWPCTVFVASNIWLGLKAVTNFIESCYTCIANCGTQSTSQAEQHTRKLHEEIAILKRERTDRLYEIAQLWSQLEELRKSQ